jgi:hypothetical protein
VKEADSPAASSRPYSSEPVTIGRDNYFNMGDQERSKFRESNFLNIDPKLYEQCKKMAYGFSL